MKLPLSLRNAPLLLGLSAMLNACIADEAPSMEADIESIALIGTDGSLLDRPEDTLQMVRSTQQEIVFPLRPDADPSALRALRFAIRTSQGATLSPSTSAPFDFSTQREHQLTVTAEDGRHSRSYTLVFRAVPSLPHRFSFEHYELEAQSHAYYTWYELSPSTSAPQFIWGTGNAGFRLSRPTAQPDEYPTSVATRGYQGAALRLCTQSTGALGQLVGKPIAAGNCFLGSFNLEQALTSPLTATQFGLPTNRKPLRFSAYYKWQPGPTFTSLKGTPAPGPEGKDAPRIYALLYRGTDAEGRPLTLDGTNPLHHEAIVARAVVTNIRETGISESEAWAHFAIDFTYTAPIDAALLARKGYKLALVFSSSAEGAQFAGAVGSTLLIDECEVSYE